MRGTIVKRLVPVFVAAVLVLAACQSVAENLTEKVVEQSAGVDEVDINTDTGELSIETDEGSIKIGGTEIPDGFPVPLPDGGEVESVFDSGDNKLVSLTYPAERYDELVAFFDEWSTTRGGEWDTGKSTYDQGDGEMARSATWVGDDVAMTITDCGDSICVTVATGAGS